MIRRLYKSFLSVVVTSMLLFGNASAQDSTATAAAPAAGGDIAAGKTLFENNCKACHNPDGEKLTGPGLKDITKRRDLAWLVKWIQNPMGVIASGDKYANDLYNQYNKTQMTAFPALKEADVQNIIAYIDDYNAPKAAAPGAVAAAPSAETGGGGFTSVIMIALIAIMALVLVALLAILRLLSKLAGVDTASTDGVSSVSFGEKVKEIFGNKTVRSAIIWVFILLAVKTTLDGLYGIGVHQGYAPKQPIKFSHKLHAGDMKINCAYCHTGVYKGKQAGIPAANICMNCHNAIKTGSPEIQKIYTAIESNKPIEWVRVHNLPDLSYFNHAQHTNVGGLDCTNCHGDVNKMEVVEQRSTLTMGWCIDCHRKTEVNGKDNKYYDKLMEAHNKTSKGAMKVEDIGGLECSKCHY